MKVVVSEVKSCKVVVRLHGLISAMPKSYSLDLRWRAVWQHLVRGLSYAEIGELLFMSERSVRRYVELYHSTGNVEGVKQKHGPDCLLTEFEQLNVLQSLIAKPNIYLSELQEHLYDATGTWVSFSTICRTVHRLGFTRKKLTTIAAQQSDELRGKFMAEISVFDPNMIVWVDEMGSDRRNAIRSYGYSLRGMRAVNHVLRVGGKRLSVIGAMSVDGIEDIYISEGNVNGDVFEDFVRTTLLPLLQPFNGTNSHSVVVMDNASIHHVHKIVEMIHGVGALVRFLPPYSPDLDPIEEAFSKVKSFLKANDTVYLSTTSARTLVSMAFNTVTPEDCIGFVSHCGYLYP